MKELLRNKKNIILAISIFLFAISLLYRVTHIYKQPKVDTLTYSGSVSKATGSKVNQKDTGVSTREESLVKLDLFLNPPAHSRDQRKNIFSEQAAIEETEASPELSSGQAQAAVNKNSLEDDLSSFRSFGYMESGGERVLFLEKGKQIMIIRKGDRIEGKYVVKDITKKELTLTVITNNEVVHIDLSDL
jgi:hypothetical protein